MITDLNDAVKYKKVESMLAISLLKKKKGKKKRKRKRIKCDVQRDFLSPYKDSAI